MKFHYCARIASALLGIHIGAAIAAPDDPAEAGASVPPTGYQSPFAQYHPIGEDKNTPWKESNETVRAIGGWRAYAKESAKAAESAKANKPGADETGKAPAAAPAAPAPGAPPPRATPPVTPPATTHKHGG